MNPNLAHAGSDRRHRLPVIRVQSLLDAVQLEAGIAARIRGKRADIAAGRRDPGYRLVRHIQVYKYLYNRSIPLGRLGVRAFEFFRRGIKKR